ncbi:thyroid adenoma-associated protein homolog isoform X2 [Anticarsia gemmatalis]|uniref:thyroid adenoma-associated protein homolog isoform X2 n=1 Tax=Anticarsia gemmatalis TaxID=129554 RepID=UPI003F76C506
MPPTLSKEAKIALIAATVVASTFNALVCNHLNFNIILEKKILKPSNDDSLVTLLKAEASQLCLYSAIATVVSAERLTQTMDEQPAIIVLMNKILAIGERSSSESTFILGVTRTLVQISRLVDKLSDRSTGLSVVESLLMFAWSHLDHHMDSVRHLTAQLLATLVRYCANVDTPGDDTALNKLLSALKCLEPHRKSYFVSVTCAVQQLGARRVLRTWPALIPHVLQALASQHVQASATTTLETLLQHHAKTCSTEELYSTWVQAILSHVESQDLDSSVLNILENLLVTAVNIDRRLMDYISAGVSDMKCSLLLLSVTRKCGAEWRGAACYQVLHSAAIDADPQIRILSLSLVVESRKSTEQFTAEDLCFILHYLKYNINAQAPNFRQLTLSVMKKFIKRLEDSYKVIKRQKQSNIEEDKVAYYLRFVEDLRQQCFDSLLPGANYSRRCVALQLLVWTDRMELDGYTRTWKPEYVDKLLLHFEDSYENNKAFAMEVLCGCPIDIVKANKYSISIKLSDILAQASSLKPTDCVSAAYKLDYVRRKLPEYIIGDKQCDAADPVTYTLVSLLLESLRKELVVCEQSVVLAARHAPMYPLLHCIAKLCAAVEPNSISSDPQWTALISDIIETCMAVNAGVASVVNNSSPEGHLPMDMSGVVVTDDGNSGGVVLDDGRQVTAQMVLLCAWRSVKEVSLLLGLISSRLTISGEDSTPGTLTSQQLAHIGEHFTSLLAETKHRGAFEQAYVGFTKLLARLWRCRSPSLHSLPRSWLEELTRTIASGEKKGSLCATRRSAGLPFMIQALVTTELQVHGNPTCFQSCISTLLSLAGSSPCEESRCHALNIVRALFRNATLDDSVAPYVGGGLVLALNGFEGGSWAERNSSTLLFSALMVRVFGVTRSRDGDSLSVRNRMTGRIFFLRYPHLYDYMLEKLEEVSANAEKQVLRPSLYPILLLLARLYPSSLEGTVSNLKLVAFIPHVLSCGASSVLKTRQLAAKAMVPLISPEHYISHIHSMFSLLTPSISRNYCHGILLQLSRLLDARPEGLEHLDVVQGAVEGTLWILQQGISGTPCYLIVDEYVQVLNLMVWRFPTLLQQDTISKIQSYLDKLLFNTDKPSISSGRDVCLANAIYLYFILLNNNTTDLVYKGLQHDSYEVILSTLNYLLILHNDLNDNLCKFQQHLKLISQNTVLEKFKNNDKYINILCRVLKNNYLECQQKSLKILTLEGDTQKFIIEAKKNKKIKEKCIIQELFDCIQNEHENLTHVYLESLLNYVTNKLNDISSKAVLNVIRIVFEYSSSDNSENTRSTVVKFIEKNIDKLLSLDTKELSDEERFELKATLWSTIITLLEDDEESLRLRMSCAVTSQRGVTSRVLGAAAADTVRDVLEQDGDRDAMFVVVALLDFKSVVVTDDGNDECRVFDQNERYNIFLEETIWTNACADKIIHNTPKDIKPLHYVTSILNNNVYKNTFDKLCNENVVLFKKMVEGGNIVRSDALNPKIELFVKRLCT